MRLIESIPPAMRRFFPLSFFLLFTLPARAAQDPFAPALAGFRQVERAYGIGVQMYTCQAGKGTPAFAFIGPEASLYHLPPGSGGEPVPVAAHTSGPVWTWRDGSGAVGTQARSAPSDKPNSIPQLLLRTTAFGPPGGALSPVVMVTRTGTDGGTSPTAGCDAAHLGTVARVPYTATYTFYAGAPR